MNQEKSVRTLVREFLAQHLRDVDVEDDEDLFGSGLVNSLFAMQLVLFVEATFGFQIANDDLDIRNFRSIDAIVALIEGRQQASAGAALGDTP